MTVPSARTGSGDIHHPRAASTTAIRAVLADLYMFIRFPALGFSLLLPLLGLSTVSPRPPLAAVGGSLAAALAFHIYAYVLNDVVDLPVDRTEPLRAEYPLVRGAIGAGPALGIALAQLPLALAITSWIAGDRRASGALLSAFALMTAYDQWGKRCRIPILTDAVQGLGWAALILYGALAGGAPPTALTAALMAYVFVYILMINGVHGALRDLANDLHCGARTTAAFLGARPGAEGSVLIPVHLKAYALGLQASLAAIVSLSLVRNWFGYTSARLGVAALASGALLLLALGLLYHAARSVHDRRELVFAGMLHLVVTLGTPLALLTPAMSPLVAMLAVTLYVLPVLAMWGFGGIKWG